MCVRDRFCPVFNGVFLLDSQKSEAEFLFKFLNSLLLLNEILIKYAGLKPHSVNCNILVMLVHNIMG